MPLQKTQKHITTQQLACQKFSQPFEKGKKKKKQASLITQSGQTKRVLAHRVYLVAQCWATKEQRVAPKKTSKQAEKTMRREKRDTC